MFSTTLARKTRVYKMDKKGRTHRFGKVRLTVFHPKRAEVVGFIIKRPDLLLMFKRRDRFVAAADVELGDRGLIINRGSDLDDASCRRLGIDFDECVIWENMPCRTIAGRELGTVSNVYFDLSDRRIDHIDISSGAVDRALIGSSDIPVGRIRGYQDGAIIVEDDAAAVEVSGGAAAKAGETWAKTAHTASQQAARAGEAINKGAYKAGEAIGELKRSVDAHRTEAAADAGDDKKDAMGKGSKAVGRQIGRASGMFKAFKEEYDKAAHDDTKDK